MKLSDWQDGVPKEEGIYQIDVPEHEEIYFARFKDGKWGVGNSCYPIKIGAYFDPINFYPYPENNMPSNPRKWRGLVDE